MSKMKLNSKRVRRTNQPARITPDAKTDQAAAAIKFSQMTITELVDAVAKIMPDLLDDNTM